MIDKKIRYQEELEESKCDIKLCKHKAQYCTSFDRLKLDLAKIMNVDGFVKLCPAHNDEFAVKNLVEDKLIFLGVNGELYKCSRCGHEWSTFFYGNKMPRSCRKCRSLSWKAPYKRRDQVQIIRRVLEQQKERK